MVAVASTLQIISTLCRCTGSHEFHLSFHYAFDCRDIFVAIIGIIFFSPSFRCTFHFRWCAIIDAADAAICEDIDISLLITDIIISSSMCFFISSSIMCRLFLLCGSVSRLSHFHDIIDDISFIIFVDTRGNTISQHFMKPKFLDDIDDAGSGFHLCSLL